MFTHHFAHARAHDAVAPHSALVGSNGLGCCRCGCCDVGKEMLRMHPAKNDNN